MIKLRALKISTIGPVVVFISILAATFFVDTTLTNQTIHKDNEIIESHINKVASGLSSMMNQRLQMVYSLIAYVKIQPNITEEEFLRFADATIGDAKGIMSIQLAPNAVVTFVSNKKDNAKAIGHDLLGDPKRRLLVEHAIKERHYIIAGPLDLLQGGRAVIARNPIFLNKPDGSDYFWGFATILLDVDTILEKAILTHKQSDINIAVRGKDALGAKGDIFYGEASVFENNPVIKDVILPSGSWQVAGSRTDAISGLLTQVIITWVVGLALAMMLALLVRRILREPEILENSIKIATHDLHLAKSEAEKLLHQADQANRAKSLFISNMSHEIRTPMNAILGFSQVILSEKNLDHGIKKSVETIYDSGNHLLGLINDILDISKIEAGQMQLNPNEFDLNELINGLSTFFQQRCNDKELRWKLKGIHDDQNLVFGDEIKLRQVLINLLGNAVKFTDSGYVELSVTKEEGNCFHFKVLDTGRGIPTNAQKSIFETFHQDSEGLKKGGTGLGLAISKKQIELMGGNLEIQSTIGEGSLFYFTLKLPLIESTKKLVEKNLSKDRVIYKLAENNTVKALIVDDSPENRTLLALFLKKIGVEIEQAEDGEKSLEKVRENIPDIIFMDIRMPLMDGLEATTEIFKEYGRDRMKIIAFTAHALDHERKEFMFHGFHDVLMKPAKKEEIYDCLKKHLNLEFLYEVDEEHAVNEDEVLDLDDIEIPAEIYVDLVEAVELGSFARVDEILASLASEEGESHPAANALAPYIKRYDVNSILILLGRMRIMANEN